MYALLCICHFAHVSCSCADGGLSLPCFVREVAGSNLGLDTVCIVVDCYDCPLSLRENSVEVLEIGGQAANGIMFTYLL